MPPPSRVSDGAFRVGAKEGVEEGARSDGRARDQGQREHSGDNGDAAHPGEDQHLGVSQGLRRGISGLRRGAGARGPGCEIVSTT